jgi:hypothetical protein
MPITRSKNQAKRSEQYILNATYDEDYDVVAVELLGYDAINGVMRRIQVDTQGRLITVTTAGASTSTSRLLEDGSQARYLEDGTTQRLLQE